MNELTTTTPSALATIPAPIPETIPASCRDVPFMTSLEIADMTGKRHADVLRDIERELAKIGDDERKFASVYLGGNGEHRPCYALPGEYLLFIASAYDAKLRMQIIRHWSALNNGTAQPVPDAANLLVNSLGQRLVHPKAIRHAEERHYLESRGRSASAFDKMVAGKP